MDRITRRDVDAAFVRALNAAKDAGLTVDHWALHGGSSTVGISWTLNTGRHGDDHVRVGPFDHIGKTAREAHHTLLVLEAAFETVARSNRILAGTATGLDDVR